MNALNTIYLDYAATTPVDPIVATKMADFLTLDGVFANPASRSHMLGWQAEAAVENARKQVATLLNADTREIIFTSGATEADNLAIKGVAYANKEKGRHIITSKTEHKAVLDCCVFLESEGFDVTYLDPDHQGIIKKDDLEREIRDDTILISLMHVNNETGVITDIGEIGRLAKSRGILFHVDAAQSAGKLPIDMQSLDIDLMSVCAHKIYGPKGIGALYVRRSVKNSVQPLIHGGGHEQGLRSGTLATHQLVGLGESFALAGDKQKTELSRLFSLREEFLTVISESSRIKVHAPLNQTFPGIVNVGVHDIDGEVLLSALTGIAISSGSACTSASVDPSHVLKAMNIDDSLALSSLRFSFGRFTTNDQVISAAKIFVDVVERLAAN